LIDRRLAARILMDIWPKAQVFVTPAPVPTLWTVKTSIHTANANTFEILLGVSIARTGSLIVSHNFPTWDTQDPDGRSRAFISVNGTSDLIGYLCHLRTYGLPDENDHRVLPDFNQQAPCVGFYYHTAKLAEALWDVPDQTPNCITVKAEGESYEVTFYRPGEPLARIKNLSGLRPYLKSPGAIEKEALAAQHRVRDLDTRGFPLTQVLDLSGPADPSFLSLDPDRLE